MSPAIHTASEPALTKLYDDLSRFQWWRRRLGRAGPGEGLAMRKRLRPGDGPLAGVEDLNPWLWRFADPGPAPRVLDLGAGFGDTLLAFARAHPGDYVGLGLSGYQVARAVRQARALGVDGTCRFERRSFDALPPGPFDLVVAVETLFHAWSLDATLRGVAAAMAPGGVLVLVEDMLADDTAATAAAGIELGARWATPRLHARADYLDALRAAGLALEAEHDLSPLLELRGAASRARRRRRLMRARAVLPWGRRVVDAFLGGLAMEELHATGALRYRALRARRPR